MEIHNISGFSAAVTGSNSPAPAKGKESIHGMWISSVCAINRTPETLPCISISWSMHKRKCGPTDEKMFSGTDLKYIHCNLLGQYSLTYGWAGSQSYLEITVEISMKIYAQHDSKHKTVTAVFDAEPSNLTAHEKEVNNCVF